MSTPTRAPEPAAGPVAAPPPRPSRPRTVHPLRPLQRPRECLATGTAEGVAHHLGVSAWLVRSFFVASAAVFGAGFFLYVWCWLLIPRASGSRVVTRRSPVAWVLVVVAAAFAATVLVMLREPLAAADIPATARLAVPIVLAAASATAGALWATLVDMRDPARGPAHAWIIRAVASVVLLVVMAAPLLRLSPQAGLILMSALVPLLGLVVVGSWGVIVKLRSFTSERIGRIREEQRSEMAAHLHDSVLQTLALIQNRAGASSEAARIARAQERELRAWLYDGDALADSDLATDLRDYAAALELDYPVQIDVVSAGNSTERASGEIAAAAREAMLNAARHVGGAVSVYVEGNERSVEVFVRDRGPGFDLEAIPEDRLGIRQSIIGRMRRAGGAATVRSDPGGTEIHLRFPAHEGGSFRG